jgi:energy-coupling factor transporter ATP-binding protein EcfA2
MITRAKFQNFKALRDVEITFDSRLTVIVGPNGSGKTSVLQGIHYLTQLAGGKGAEAIFWGPYQFRHLYHSQGTGDIILEMARKGTGPIASLRFHATAPSDILSAPVPDGRWQVAIESLEEKSGPAPIGWQIHYRDSAPPSLRGASSAVWLKLDAGQLAAPSYSETVPPRLRYDGEGLASVLAHMQQTANGQFSQLVTAVTQVVPTVRDLRIEWVPVPRTETETIVIDGQSVSREVRRVYTGHGLLFDFQRARGVIAAHASEGTLLTVGLLTVLFGPNPPRLILLDDLDQALHPKAQMELVDLLRQVLARHTELQIVATAHSPYILDKLHPNEVRVMALREDGTAVCGRLEDHPKYPMWKDSMSPGEFWTHAGEDWVKNLKAESVAQ